MKQKTEWTYVPFIEAVDILDSFRKPINRKERDNRILNKKTTELFPYYGATGQVGYIDDYLLEGEYVLLGEDGAPFLDAYANKAYMITGKSWVNNHAHILLSKYNNSFLCYYLNYFNYKGYVSGTTRLKLTQSDMKRIPIPVPPVAEQERIVSQIEESLSQLDSAVETLKKTKQQLEVYRQAVLKEAFEKRATKGEYSVVPLSSLAPGKDGLRRGPFGGSIKKSCFVPKGYKVYEQGNAINDTIDYGKYYITEEKYREMSSFQTKPHDLLVSCSGSLGRITELPDNAPMGIINQALLRIRLDKTIVNTKYFIEYFRSELFQRKIFSKSQGSAMANLVGIKDFKEITMIIPDLQTQIHVLDYLSERLSICESIQHTVDESLQQAEALRQSILKQAFEG